MIDGAGADVRVGKVDLLASGLAQRNTALVGDDANNLDPYGFGSLNADKNAFADCRLTRIRVIGHNFIDNDLGVARLVIFIGECAALEQRGVHGLEVAGKHNERIDCLIFTRVSERVFEAPADRAEATGEWKWI